MCCELIQFEVLFYTDDVQQSVRPAEMRTPSYIAFSWLPALVSFYTLPKCTLQLTTAPSSTWFIVLLIHCCIYRIHCWNYALLNQSKQAEQMKSSDIVTLIISIRFLPSSYVLLLLQLNELWSVAEQ